MLHSLYVALLFRIILLRLTTFYAYNTLFPLYLLTLHLPRANDALAKKNEQQQDHRGTLHLDVSIIYPSAQFAYTDTRYLL